MVEQMPDMFLTTRLGDTSRDYAEWRAKVLDVRLLPEYKLKKLWKLNFTPQDIAADRHWEVFPPDRHLRIKKVRGIQVDGSRRGRAISQKKKDWIYARALRDAADGLLLYHALSPEMRTQVQKERDHFAALVKKYGHRDYEA